MFFGKIEALKQYISSDCFMGVSNLLSKSLKGEIPFNEWILLENEMKAILLDKSNKAADTMEFHKLFSDIHITIQGRDIIYTCDNCSEVIQEYQEMVDYGLYKATDSINEFINDAGHFVLIGRDEAHCNILNEHSIKLVIKLKYA